jgi:hypothetical protein
MTVIPAENIPALQQVLDKQVRDQAWRKVLHTLAVTGVADNQQLIRATGLQRDKLRRTLEKMTAAAAGFSALFTSLDQKVIRTGERGAKPRVFRLAESGAALCKAEGLTDARACSLEDARAIRHALGMLDVHLAALDAGLAVLTDRNMNYGEEAFIRPDNLVTIPSGQKAIFESEQDARSDFLERIRRSLNNKVAFFESAPLADVSTDVRMLVDLPRGKLWQHTLSVWWHAVEITREAHAGDLPFRLLAMPLGEFLGNPDWSIELDSTRWIDLTGKEAALPPVTAQSLLAIAQQVPAFSNQERRMVLAALLQHLQESGQSAQQIQPDVDFLYSMRLIYLASQDPFSPALVRSGVPRESLYLLDQYLKMTPALGQLVEQTIQKDARRIHWNQSTALHRMQVVVDAFLEFHGWQSSGPLLAYSFTPDYQAHGPRHMSVAVEITDPEILLTGETNAVPGKQEVQMLEKSLAWALTALFAYSHHLGLKKAPFW